MSGKYTLRATLLTGCIIVGSVVQSGAGQGLAGLALLELGQTALQGGADLLQSLLNRGLGGIVSVLETAVDVP